MDRQPEILSDAARSSSRFMNLLSPRECELLKGVFERLAPERGRILKHWYELYEKHFQGVRALKYAEFQTCLGSDLDALMSDVLAMDTDGIAQRARSLGHDLATRGVPFSEVIASLHLFEEAAVACFGDAEQAVRLYLVFDKLSHCRVMLLAEAYFLAREASAAARVKALEREAARLGGGVECRSTFHGLVGQSAGLREVYRRITAAARGRSPVLITGESGTGKELVARALHECSTPSQPFIAVNCAALPRELIESELFGHRKGAYTGAFESMGLIRAAAGGTLFLDEITEMGVDAQAKLLRVLEQGAVRAVGATEEQPVQVRFVASTNRQPRQAIDSHLLREDLWHRLCGHLIEVPPLRERLDDIEPLTQHFLAFFAARGLPAVDGVDAAALRALTSYRWPGNVRELRNVIEQALSFAQGSVIGAADLPEQVGRSMPRVTRQVPSLRDAERALIEQALAAARGNKAQAALLLRISRHKLYDCLRRYDLA